MIVIELTWNVNICRIAKQIDQILREISFRLLLVTIAALVDVVNGDETERSSMSDQ